MAMTLTQRIDALTDLIDDYWRDNPGRNPGALTHLRLEEKRKLVSEKRQLVWERWQQIPRGRQTALLRAVGDVVRRVRGA